MLITKIQVEDIINNDKREIKLPIYRYKMEDMTHILYDVKIKVSGCKCIDKE